MDVNSCRQILEKDFPQIPIHFLSVIQEGWDMLLLVIDNRYIFRFPRRKEIEAQLEKEINLLPRLAEILPVPVPQVAFARRKSAGDAYTLMGYPMIFGESLAAQPAVSEAVVRQLGEFLSALHRCPIARFLPILGGSAAPQAQREPLAETYTWVQELTFPHLSKPDRLAASLLWEVYLSSQDNFIYQPRLIHGDLAPEHILCDPHGGFLTGVIDWGDACLGDPALDFAGLFSLGGEMLVDRVLMGYSEPVDETFRRRVRFYHTIAPFYEIRHALTCEDWPRLLHAIKTLSERLRV